MIASAIASRPIAATGTRDLASEAVGPDPQAVAAETVAAAAGGTRSSAPTRERTRRADRP